MRKSMGDMKPCPLLVSQAKSTFNEKDLLMMCVDQPHYLSRALGHDNNEGTGLTTLDQKKEMSGLFPRYCHGQGPCSNNEGTGLTTLDQKKEMLSYFYKAWSGLAKYIKRQCAEQGKCVDFPLVGRFIQRRNVPITMEDESEGENRFTFIPHLDFVSSGKFKFP